ncbi:MAG: hypothetical protein ACE5JR_08230 [Gemmatimonadota bacterium]
MSLVSVIAPFASAQELPDSARSELIAAGHTELAARLEGLLRPVSVPSDGKARDFLTRWERTAGGPSTGYQWLAVSHLWLRVGDGPRADAALRRAAAEGAPAGLVLLGSAHVAFLKGDVGGGGGAYWAGCAAADSSGADEVARAYWSEIEPLATPAEQKAWEARLEGPDPTGGLCEELGRFWNRRAARAALSVAERIALHDERVRYARPRYARPWPDREGILSATVGGRPLSNRIGRPRRAAFDDRGLVYLRMGPPDRTAGFGGSVAHPVIGPTCYHANESWAYDGPEGTRVYHFSPLEGTAEWWLIENLEDLYRCGDPDFVRTVRMVQSVSPVLGPRKCQRDRCYEVVAVGQLQSGLGGGRPPIGRIAYLVLPDLYLSRQGLDPRYARLGYRFFDPSPDTMYGQLKQGVNGTTAVLTTQAGLAEEREWTWADARHAITTVPDRPAVARDAKLRFEVLQFRGDSAGLVRAWWNGIVEAGPLRPDTLPDGRLRYRIEAALALLDEGERYRRVTRTVELTSRGPLPAAAAIPVRIPVAVEPGRYEFTVLVREPAGPEASGARTPTGNYLRDSLRVRGFAAALPELSDIAVSPDSGGDWTAGGGIHLRPSPLHATGPDGIAHVYYEVYGLSPGGDYETSVRLEPLGDGEPFTLTFRGSAAPAPSPVHGYLRLELGDTEPGEYRMAVTVRDRASGTSTLPYRTHILVESG